MPAATLLRLEGRDSNASRFELKGWRWEYVCDRPVKIDPLKSFPGASSVNETLAIDFGENVPAYVLMGRLKSQKQFNTLKDNIKNKWFADGGTTLTIGTGASAITADGTVAGLHSVWIENKNQFEITIHFIQGVLFPR